MSATCVRAAIGQPVENVKRGRPRLLAAVLVALTLAGYARTPAWPSPGATGQVVEEGAGRPLHGAIVVALWEQERGSLTSWRTYCVRAASATTDAQGNYRLPDSGGGLPNRFYVYKSGFRHAQIRGIQEPIAEIPRTVELRRFSGTNQARLDELLELEAATSCQSARETGSEANLLTIRRAIYAEAKGVARSRSERESVDRLLYEVELVELGFAEAEERMVAREEARRGR